MLGTRDRTKYIEKHDLESGKLLWASEKITQTFSMPNLYKAGDRVFASSWEVSSSAKRYRMETRSNQWEEHIQKSVAYVYWDYKAQKNSVLCLDDASGKTVWRSERFDKRITDLIIDENKTVLLVMVMNSTAMIFLLKTTI